jgi:hypothetical protein
VRQVRELSEDSLHECVRDMIRAHIAHHRLSPDATHGYHEVKRADGGVDRWTELSQGDAWIPIGKWDWQFKASGRVGPAVLAKALRKVSGRLREGWGYVFCVAGDCNVRALQQRGAQVLRSLELPADRLLVRDAEKLADWFSTNLAMLYRSEFRESRPLHARTHGEWAKLFQEPRGFFEDDSRKRAIEEIRRFCRDADARAVRLEGPPGVGKTRLALEALDADGSRERVVYLKSAEDTEVDSYIVWAGRTKAFAVLVIDECDPLLHIKLESRVRPVAPQLRLISIGRTEHWRAPAPETIRVEKLPAAEMERLLRAEFPMLTFENVERVRDAASGFVKAAVFLAQALARSDDPATYGRLLDPSNMDPFLERALSEGERTNVRALALFEDLGWEEPHKVEREAVAQSLGLDRGGFQDVVATWVGRGLASERGRLRYVTPEILANWLAAWLMKDRCDDVVSVFFDLARAGHRRAWEAFLARLVSAGENERAQEVARRILRRVRGGSEGGGLPDGEAAECIRILSKIVRSDALAALRGWIGAMSAAELASAREARRGWVWALEHLAWPEELFPEAARLLLALAESENEAYANNATGVWCSLFQPMLPGTEATPGVRLDVLRETFASSSAPRRRLAVMAAGAAIGGPMETGRVPPTGYTHGSARTPAERQAYREAAVEICRHALADPDDTVAAAGRQVLAEKTRLHLGTPLGERMLDACDALAPVDDDAFRRLRGDLENALIRRGGAYPDETLARIRRLATRWNGESFGARLRRWCGKWSGGDWARDDESGRPRAEVELERLAVEAVERPDQMEAELDWLLSPAADHAEHFGVALGHADGSERWKDPLLTRGAEGVALFAGYLAGQALSGHDYVEDLLDRLAVDRPDLAPAVMGATARGTASARGAHRLLAMVDSGALEVRALGVLVFGAWCVTLDEADAFAIMGRLISDRSQAVEPGLMILSQWVDRHASGPRVLEMARRAVELLPALAPAMSGSLGHHWMDVARLRLDAEPLAIIDAVIAALRVELLHGAPVDVFLEALARDPAEGWERVGEAWRSGGTAAFRLELILDDVHALGDPVKQALLRWARAHRPEGPRLAARLLPPAGVPLDASVRALLIEFGDDPDVRRTLARAASPRSHVGARSLALRAQVNVVERWTRDEHPRVRAWAKQVHANLTRELKEFEVLEAEDPFMRA